MGVGGHPSARRGGGPVPEDACLCLPPALHYL